VAAILRSLEQKKAPGPDHIKNEIFKINADIWTPYLTRLLMNA